MLPNASKTVHPGLQTVHQLLKKNWMCEGQKHDCLHIQSKLEQGSLSITTVRHGINNAAFLYLHSQQRDFNLGLYWYFSVRCTYCGEKKVLNANEQLSLIVEWLTFPSQIRAGFSASLVEMLMVLPSRFNVNPILVFFPLLLLLERKSLLPYTAAGGTGSGLKPPSGSQEPTQDRGRNTLLHLLWWGIQ